MMNGVAGNWPLGFSSSHALFLPQPLLSPSRLVDVVGRDKFGGGEGLVGLTEAGEAGCRAAGQTRLARPSARSTHSDTSRCFYSVSVLLHTPSTHYRSTFYRYPYPYPDPDPGPRPGTQSRSLQYTEHRPHLPSPLLLVYQSDQHHCLLHVRIAQPARARSGRQRAHTYAIEISSSPPPNPPASSSFSLHAQISLTLGQHCAGPISS